MFDAIQVTYKSTNSVVTANQYLREISKHSIFAADFETALKYTPEELSYWQSIHDDPPSKLDFIRAKSILKATALDHPSHGTLTHLSIATSDSFGYVFILDNPAITRRVLNFLVTTPLTQVWHNASYDFQRIYYYTKQFPLNYEDTQILAKTLVNHTNPLQAKTGLKQLAGYKYGDWGISADNFTVEQMYEPHVLKYAATDSCATLWLWNYLQEQCDLIDKEIIHESNTDDSPPDK